METASVLYLLQLTPNPQNLSCHCRSVGNTLLAALALPYNTYIRMQYYVYVSLLEMLQSLCRMNITVTLKDIRGYMHVLSGTRPEFPSLKSSFYLAP